MRNYDYLVKVGSCTCFQLIETKILNLVGRAVHIFSWNGMHHHHSIPSQYLELGMFQAVLIKILWPKCCDNDGMVVPTRGMVPYRVPRDVSLELESLIKTLIVSFSYLFLSLPMTQMITLGCINKSDKPWTALSFARTIKKWHGQFDWSFHWSNQIIKQWRERFEDEISYVKVLL